MKNTKKSSLRSMRIRATQGSENTQGMTTMSMSANANSYDPLEIGNLLCARTGVYWRSKLNLFLQDPNYIICERRVDYVVGFYCLNGVNLYYPTDCYTTNFARFVNEQNYLNKDLTGKDLTGKNFTYANCRNAIFKGAILTNANFTNANLTGANLSNANITGANLSGAILTGANLSGLDLSGANLSGRDFSNTNLSNANLSNANFSNVNLTNTILTSATLTGINLSNTNLSGRDFSNTNFSGANLTGADFSNTNFTGANLSDTNLTNARFLNAEITGANLTGATFFGTFFYTIDFNSIILSNELTVTGLNSNVGQQFTGPDKIDKISIGTLYDNVNTITINDTTYGNSGGNQTNELQLTETNYINEIAYSFSSLGICDYLEFKTKNGDTIKAGNMFGPSIRRLKNIKLVKINGKFSSAYFTNLTFTFTK